jgi:hypothetical protein
MAYVQGRMFGPTGKVGSGGIRRNRTVMATHLERIGESSIEDDVSLEIALTVDGHFELLLRVNGNDDARSLAKGNVRVLAAEIRRANAKVRV